MTDVPAAPDWRIIDRIVGDTNTIWDQTAPDLKHFDDPVVGRKCVEDYNDYTERFNSTGVWTHHVGNIWASDSLGLTVVLPQGEVPPKPRPVKKKPPMPMGVPSDA